MKFINHYNYQKPQGEINNGKSKTVPDQTMSIREIINRTKKGLPVTGVKVPMYNETEDGILPDLTKMDISEVHELKKRLATAEKNIRKQLQEQEEAENQRKAEQYYREKLAKEQQEKDKLKKPEPVDNPTQ